MFSYLIALFVQGLLVAFYRWPPVVLSILWFITPFVWYKLGLITNTQGLISLLPILLTIMLLHVRPIRRFLITSTLLRTFNNKDYSEWSKFRRIDDGWLVSQFEKELFIGRPTFSLPSATDDTIGENCKQLLKELKETKIASSFSQQLIKHKLSVLHVPLSYGGCGFNVTETAQVISQIASAEPLLGAVVGSLNGESVISLIDRFGSKEQREHYLPAFASGDKQVFFTPTFLYELLENGRSSIEGRVDSVMVGEQKVYGIRVNFDDVMLLGTAHSSMFYLAVNVTDFSSELSDTTRLGTALCLFDTDHNGLKVTEGNSTYKGLFRYYECSAKNLFIPLSQIVGGFGSINQGIRQLYQLQVFAANLWPAAVSLPIQKAATLISWYFSHIKKQNGRILFSFKLVRKQLNRQFTHSQRLHLLQQMGLANHEENLVYSHILFKNTIFDGTLRQLTLLRTILGSHAHNIKSQNKLNQYFRIKHLSMELDGDSHELNQLPLMKKVALSAHPYYDQEVELLSQKTLNLKALDLCLFRHTGLIFHQLSKIWVYAVRSSWLGRFIWHKSKYQNLTKRICSSFALIADMALIKWSIKQQSNTEFTGHLADCHQQLVLLTGLINRYQNADNNSSKKFLLKLSLKDSFYLSQTALNQCINSAFSKYMALLLKIIIFPFGKPFHQAGFTDEHHQPLPDDEELQKSSQEYVILRQISQAAKKLQAVQQIEQAISNATGSTLTTKNHQVLINRTLAAGIVSVEQAEQIRAAYDAILEIQLINHFGKNNEE